MGTISKALEKSQHSFDFEHKTMENKNKSDDNSQNDCDHTKTDIEHRSNELEQVGPINSFLFSEEYQKMLTS